MAKALHGSWVRAVPRGAALYCHALRAIPLLLQIGEKNSIDAPHHREKSAYRFGPVLIFAKGGSPTVSIFINVCDASPRNH